MGRLIQTILRPFTDDRGRPIRFVPGQARDGEDDDPDAEDWFWEGPSADSDLAGHAIGIVVLGVIVLGAVWRMPFWLILAAAILAGLALYLAARGLLERPIFCSRGHAFIHAAVRDGRCAACGYPLAGVREAADGCLECPECSAAWRGERSRCPALGGADHRRLRRGRLRAVARFSTPTPYLDHRGRDTNPVLYRPCKRPEGDYLARCDDAARAIYAPVRRWGLVLAALVLALGAWLFMLVLNAAREPGGVGASLYAVLPVMAVSIFLAFLLRSGDVLVRRIAIERETLARGLCPSCWELLEGLARGEDGCTTCPECGSSWRLPERARGESR